MSPSSVIGKASHSDDVPASEEYIAVGHASSIALALGLNHSCILTLADAEDATVRTTFHTVYFLERSISLRLGRPNRMAAVKDEIDPVILPPESPDVSLTSMRSLEMLGSLMTLLKPL